MAMKISDNSIDDNVDQEISECLNLDKPKSFFLFAGAGSGKTRSLVEVLKRLKDKYEQRLRLNRQQIAVITYTNAACEEIKNRLEHNSIFSVSTIHSFIWVLIQKHTTDIKQWLQTNLQTEIEELEEQQRKGRTGKASIDRLKKIESKKKRLDKLPDIKKFIYNPDGDNNTRDSLNHAEVIHLGAYFLLNKPLMQKILTGRHPILLVDESQDTKKELIDAFFEVQAKNSAGFSLGLFGDTMQRIYSDGKENLGVSLPSDWARPAKRMNHRCPKRVITLINKIRSTVDGQEQIPRAEKSDGTVRFFISDQISDKAIVEGKVRDKMKEITGDELWSGDNRDVKTLILEHHMSAKRKGFSNLFEPLYKVERMRTGLLDGSLSSMRLFTQNILPLVAAHKAGNQFEKARVVRLSSPFFKKEILQRSASQLENIRKSDEAVKSLLALWDNDNSPTLLEILKNVFASGLFTIPDSLLIIASRNAQDQKVIEEEKATTTPDENEEDEDEAQDENIIDAWDLALNSSFDEVVGYNEYISDKSEFATHQGVKGLQFPRVMVILDDEEARGFMFSYDKLVGAKQPSDTDKKNISDGKETSNDRTLRLFYVSCSRAQESLAIIMYTSNPSAVKSTLLKEGWFDENEIVII